MKVLFKQHWHVLILLLLATGLYFYVTSSSAITTGSLFGVSTLKWFLLSCLVPVTHQVYVLICWRTELFYKSLSSRFGDFGFTLYKIGFVLLILSRLISILLLAISNANSFEMSIALRIVLSTGLLLPATYLFLSVFKYFGFSRAVGSDHFEPEKARNTPFVKEGIFKYTPNGMYTFGFLVAYIPGVLLASESAIIIALFSHIYIWVHYYFTELPDIKVIYGH